MRVEESERASERESDLTLTLNLTFIETKEYISAGWSERERDR